LGGFVIIAADKAKSVAGVTKDIPPRRADGGLAVLSYIAGMCGRATYKPTWEEIVALYRLTLGQRFVLESRFEI
jgi:hypothetical protein